MKSSVNASRKTRAVRFLWLAEMLALILAVMIAAWIRFHGDTESHIIFSQQAPLRAVLVALFITGAMAAFGMYQVHVRHNRLDFLLRATLSFAFGGIALVVLYYLIPQTYIGRGVLAMSLAMGLAGVILVRAISVHVIRAFALREVILVFVAGKYGELIYSVMRRQYDLRSFVLVGDYGCAVRAP